MLLDELKTTINDYYKKVAETNAATIKQYEAASDTEEIDQNIAGLKNILEKTESKTVRISLESTIKKFEGQKAKVKYTGQPLVAVVNYRQEDPDSKNNYFDCIIPVTKKASKTDTAKHLLAYLQSAMMGTGLAIADLNDDGHIRYGRKEGKNALTSNLVTLFQEYDGVPVMLQMIPVDGVFGKADLESIAKSAKKSRKKITSTVKGKAVAKKKGKKALESKVLTKYDIPDRGFLTLKEMGLILDKTDQAMRYASGKGELETKVKSVHHETANRDIPQTVATYSAFSRFVRTYCHTENIPDFDKDKVIEQLAAGRSNAYIKAVNLMSTKQLRELKAELKTGKYTGKKKAVKKTDSANGKAILKFFETHGTTAETKEAAKKKFGLTGRQAQGYVMAIRNRK